MFMTTAQLADELQMPAKSVSALAKTNKLPASKVGKHWLFIREDVENAIRADYDEEVVRGDLRFSKGEKQCKPLQLTSMNDEEPSITTSDSTDNGYENLLNAVRKPKPE